MLFARLGSGAGRGAALGCIGEWLVFCSASHAGGAGLLLTTRRLEFQGVIHLQTRGQQIIIAKFSSCTVAQ
jgi:hypothetical protein